MDGALPLTEMKPARDAARPALPEPALYRGTVAHKRVTPFAHDLTYKVFSLLLDIDALDRTADSLRLFRHNRAGILSFHDRDHGARDGTPLRPWLNRVLRENGFDLEDCPVRLLTFPRLWGYVFNPLSIYYCYDRHHRLAATLYEVSNTFGEWHGYLLPADRPGAGPVTQRTEKVFHVSPFMPVDGEYRFTLTPPGETLSVMIRYQDDKGSDRMTATHTAHRTTLTDAALASALVKHPLMSLKVMAGIHWEALKLWKKGAKFHPKPDLPRNRITR